MGILTVLANLADMQLISEFNKWFRFLLFVVMCKYAWVIPIKYQKGITVTNAFQKIKKKKIKAQTKQNMGR